MSHNLLVLSTNGEATKPFIVQLHREYPVVDEVKTVPEAERTLLAQQYHVLIVRAESLNEELLNILQFIRQHRLPTRVIMLSKSSSIQDAVRAFKAGAFDFIVNTTLNDLTLTSLRQSISQLDETGAGGESAGSAVLKGASNGSASKQVEAILVGKSKAMNDVRTAVGLVAQSNTPVLITGESGTGKEIVARLIHLQSGRADQPFIAVNCAAIPKDVIENELFGHEKGAFTGALFKKSGCFELAHGGTLFFDEIAEMSPDTQAKLLRAIETKSFRRLGGREEVTVDVRLIAATNKNMTEALKSKEFREDLYYRFSVIEIYMPALRDRREDISVLADHFLRLCCGHYRKPKQSFSEEAMSVMMRYDWPGNVRELRNIVERSVVTCSDKVIGEQYLPERISTATALGTTLSLTIGMSLEEVEQKFIAQTIAACGNNKTRAAQVLGMSRKTIHNRLHKLKA